MRWEVRNGGQVAFKIHAAGSADYSQFSFEKVGELDLRIQAKSVSSTAATIGTVIVAGDAMLVRGLPLKDGAEFEAADVPWLASNLVLTALETAIPEGPAAVTGTRNVDVKNQYETLRVGTFLTMRDFPPPWRLQGTIVRKTAQVIEYSLRFSYSVEDGTRVLDMVGNWDESTGSAPLSSSMSIKGWNAFLLPYSLPQASTRRLARIQSSAITLGELREDVKKAMR